MAYKLYIYLVLLKCEKLIYNPLKQLVNRNVRQITGSIIVNSFSLIFYIVSKKKRIILRDLGAVREELERINKKFDIEKKELQATHKEAVSVSLYIK